MALRTNFRMTHHREPSQQRFIAQTGLQGVTPMRPREGPKGKADGRGQWPTALTRREVADRPKGKAARQRRPSAERGLSGKQLAGKRTNKKTRMTTGDLCNNFHTLRRLLYLNAGGFGEIHLPEVRI